jgi:hypothetical protein
VFEVMAKLRSQMDRRNRQRQSPRAACAQAGRQRNAGCRPPTESAKTAIAPTQAHAHFAGDDEAVDQAESNSTASRNARFGRSRRRRDTICSRIGQVLRQMAITGPRSESRAHAELDQRQVDGDQSSVPR